MHFFKLSLLPLAFGLVQAQQTSLSAAFTQCIETCGSKADPTGEWVKCASAPGDTAKVTCFCSIKGFLTELATCLEATCPNDYKPYSAYLSPKVCAMTGPTASPSVMSSPSVVSTTYTPSASPSGSPPYPSHGNKTVPHGTGSPSMMSSGSASAAPTGSTPTYHSKGSNSSAPTPSQSPGTGSAGSLQVLLQWPLAFALAAGALAAL